MKASFGANIKGLNNPSTVWMDDATYKDTSGSATMTAKETEVVTKHLSMAGSTFQKINSGLLDKFLTIQNSFTGDFSGASLKTYNNSLVYKSEAGDQSNFESIRYEGFGPKNIAVIIDTLTDNKNRTASSIRTLFQKSGGSLGLQNL